ncbi:hypothetical protein GQ457_07G021900 [Hibiscus cannabinus]
MCTLCGVELETRSHLFAECSFSAQLWGFVLQNCDACVPIDFDFFRDFWMSFNTYRRLSTMGGWGKQSWWSDGGYGG